MRRSQQHISTHDESSALSGPRLADRLKWRTIGAPAPTSRYVVRDNIETPMRDGVLLLSTLYTPANGSARSTVLVRTPYRRAASAHNAQFFAGQGYNVLVQACRGTDGSGGVLEPMVSESEDGNDTVQWMRAQPWWTGDFITYGASYVGFVQYALLEEEQPELKGMIIEVAPFDFAETAWGRGPFDQLNFLAWSAMMSREEPTPTSIFASMRAMNRQERAVKGAITDNPGPGASTPSVTSGSPWHETWVTHPDVGDPFWARFRHRRALENINVPVLLSGAWQDLFLRQTLTAWQEFQRRGVDLQVHIHNGTHLRAGLRAYQGRYWTRIRDWLQRLDAGTAPASANPRFTADISGTTKQRIALEAWPPTASTRTFALNAGGRLDPQAGAAAVARFVFDPAVPTRTIGGHTMATDAGVRVNNAVEAQADLLTFTSDPQQETQLIAGNPRITLSLSADQPSFDVFIRLCDVDGRGRSRNITDEMVRLRGVRPGTSRVHVIQLQGTVHALAVGHRLRVQVSGGATPRFSINDENGNRPVQYELELGDGASVIDVPIGEFVTVR